MVPNPDQADLNANGVGDDCTSGLNFDEPRGHDRTEPHPIPDRRLAKNPANLKTACPDAGFGVFYQSDA